MGIIYLLCELGSNPERYKIGVTKGDPLKRIKQLQTGSSNEITLLKSYESEYYRKIESVMHRELNHYSCNGGTEWFILPLDVINNFEHRCKELDDNFKALSSMGNPFFK